MTDKEGWTLVDWRRQAKRYKRRLKFTQHLLEKREAENERLRSIIISARDDMECADDTGAWDTLRNALAPPKEG